MQSSECQTKDDCLQWVLSHLHWERRESHEENSSDKWILQANSDRMGFVVIEIYKEARSGKWAWMIGEQYGKNVRDTEEFKSENVSESLLMLLDRISDVYHNKWTGQ